MAKNKKAMLLASEVIKIVVSVIAITFLIYFLVLLYFSKINAEKTEQAKQIMIESKESVKNLIGLVQEGNFSSREKNLGNPEAWYLFSFTKKKKPSSCFNAPCLCICNNVWDVFDRQIKECDKNGVCFPVENLDPKTNLELKIQSKPITKILIKKENNLIKITEIKS